MPEPCRDPCADLAAEVALGLVTGHERATALAHLQACAACRQRVGELTAVHDRLRALVPPAEPPVGFETRVLKAIERPGRWRRPGGRQRRVAVAAGIAAALAGAAIGGSVLAAPSGHPAPAAPSGHTVLTASLQGGSGTVFLDPHTPSWVYLYLDAPSGNGRLTCALQRADGSVAASAPMQVAGDDAYWGGPAPSEVTAVRITDEHGTVVASARLPVAEHTGG